MTTAERRRRHFSDSFKIQKVRELEKGKTKVSELCKQYEVTPTHGASLCCRLCAVADLGQSQYQLFRIHW